MALDFPSPATPGQIFDSWEWDGTKWIPAPGSALIGVTIPIVFFFPGLPAPSFLIPVPIVTALAVPANFAGSWFNTNLVATANAVFEVRQSTTSGTNVVGTITVQTGGQPIWSTAGFNLNPQDTLWMEAPATQDATLNGPSFTILATRA